VSDGDDGGEGRGGDGRGGDGRGVGRGGGPGGAWWALLAAGRDLRRWPTVTGLALVAAMTASLAARAGLVRAAQLVTSTPGGLDVRWAALGRASLVLLLGAGLAALLVDVAMATALVAYAGPAPITNGPARLATVLRSGLLRTPAMISVRALEFLVYYALAVGDLFVLTAGLTGSAPSPERRALAATVLLAPSLALATLTFVAARVAQVLVARGLHPAPALVHGLDLALRRFASLARLGLAAGLATAPLWLLALLMPAPLAAMLAAIAALWSFAALAQVVGHDSRLAFG
jgi:hypothetical protein